MLWVKAGGFLMMAAVILGAFGAHGLKHKLSSEMMEIFKTASLYHMVHGLGLFIVAWLSTTTQDPKIGSAGTLFIIGIVLFSGSLYVLSVTGLRWLGAITPLGGLCFITGWLLIALSKIGL